MARPRNKGTLRTYLITFVMVTVTIVWAASFIAKLVSPTIETPAGVNEVMMVVVGFLFSMRQASVANTPTNESEDEEDA